MKITQLLIFLIVTLNVSAQNLVLNPSFEAYEKCPESIGQFNYTVKHWSTPNFASTDYFNVCSKTHGSINYNGVQTPRTGKGYAGIYVVSDQNYREYVQGELSKTLEKDKKYNVTFYVSLADESSYAIKDITILFSEEKLRTDFNSNAIEKVIKPKKLTNKRFESFSNSIDEFYEDKENWMQFSFELTSKGYERYFSIGNFNKNSKTVKQKTLSQSPHYFSYYYIDDVSVISLEKEHTKEVEKISEEPKINTNEIYTFKKVLFDFDKAELLEVSIEELNQLYKHLNNNSNLSIEIYGHTDTIGLDKRNIELSKERAKAVADYLILQGLERTRIKSFGFGSSQPISDNTTEEGRQDNRRVEFKLIDN